MNGMNRSAATLYATVDHHGQLDLRYAGGSQSAVIGKTRFGGILNVMGEDGKTLLKVP